MVVVPFRLRTLFLSISCAAAAMSADAKPGEAPSDSAPRMLAQMFDPALIRGDGNVDFGHLLAGEGGAMLPGVYPFDVILNGDAMGKRDIQMIKQGGAQKVAACITDGMLEDFGVRRKQLDELALRQSGDCLDISLLDKRARVEYDPGQMRLMITIPQAYMVAGKRGYVDPSLWDYGVNAGFVNYQANMRSDTYSGRSNKSYYLGMVNGVNLGGWRLRNESNLTKSDMMSTQFKSNRTFVQHDVTALKGQFSAGEIYSGSDIFGSVRFRGVQLSSDEAMLADSERGYAPVVRGVAETNATVEVRQNGYLLTSAPVSPGPFALPEIYPNGSNGDLEVTVIEADGRRRTFRQTYASLPLMVRRGTLRYSAELGQYKSTSSELPTPTFGSASLVYGLTENVSLAGGAQVSSDYQAVNVGLGGNTPIGAVSVDVTHSRSVAAGKTNQGQSVRALYSKTLTETNTTFTLAAYRYSTEGYRTFDNHVYDTRKSRTEQDPARAGFLSKSRLDLTVNQQLGDAGRYGSLYLNGSQEHYWNKQRSTSVSAGYGNNWGRVSYNISYSRSATRSPDGLSRNDNIIMLSLSIPLGSGRNTPSLYLSGMRAKEGTSSTASVNGYVPGSEYTSYSLQGARSQNGDKSGAISLTSDLPLARVGGNYSNGTGYHSYGVNASGAIVGHAGGVNLSREVGDSFALVHVDGVKGVGVGNNLPKTGYNAYTIYPYTQPYRVNTVRLDAETLGADTEIETLTQSVVPRRGAIVATRFKGYSGRRVQMRFNWAQGKLPIGAAVEDEEGRQVGLVDNNGQALLLLRNDSGRLKVRWQDASCEVSYQLPERDPARYYDRTSETCQ
ncbi:fimbria/pilus outer membrane usher protein [Pusillimonas sp. SM2304]|uniref:fimbria/pilus outer membrane usher protein n=1 Tax=Pusillimonas sp. SM2304 TaxID=3073241 RepID=UPI00287490CA|nr:fimbria/pilus outer membrane usher protein [Pusillimonas sp. SM2304]MDS1138895.1 fimbria/pilus outer membrane usher protein [Pusillimonas sp. SM2304]